MSKWSRGKKAGAIVLAVVLVLAVVIAISLATSRGVINLAIRNATAFDKDIPDPGWEGNSYEHVQYSDISESDYLDLYVPTSNEAMPLIVMVHGGGFVANDSQSRQAVLMYQYFRSRGYACATINYRLAQEATYPAAVEDVKAAVRFLRANAAQYGYDPDKFAIWGESAGGYLASMEAVSTDEEYSGVSYIGEDENNPVSAKVDALIDFYGVLDIDKVDSDFRSLGTPEWLIKISSIGLGTDEQDPMSRFMGKDISDMTEEEIDDASPTKKAARLTPGELDVYITHGSVDITVPKLQSIRMYEVCEQSIGEDHVIYKERKNFKHADDRFYLPKNLEEVQLFLQQVWGQES